MSQQGLSPQLTLKQLYDGLNNGEVPTILERARSYLDPKVKGWDLLREDGDKEHIPKLLLLASELLVLKGDLWTKEVPGKTKQQTQRVLEIIELIDNLSEGPSNTEDTFLLRLLACTDPRDPWMTATSSEIISRLCQRYSARLTSSDFLIEQILKNTVRPLFSKSRPTTITPAARKAINPHIKRPNEPSDIDPSSKPWKFEKPSTITLFRWAIDHADSDLLTQNWPLFIPPLLTLLDDTTTELRARASELLSTLLSITPSKLLQQTGLGEVFEDAVMPTLLYLPSLTPTDESIRLLKPAYKVLFELADIRWNEEGRDKVEKLKFYDRVMRRGVLQGAIHAADDVGVMEVLIGEMGGLIGRMGIYAVKHLKAAIPHLTNPLLSPFTTSHPTLLGTTLRTTQTLIQNTWPRLNSEPLLHRNAFINALCVCWIHVCDTSTQNTTETNKIKELRNVRKELIVTGHLLIKAIAAGNERGEGSIREELRPIMEIEVGFEELFFGELE